MKLFIALDKQGKVLGAFDRIELASDAVCLHCGFAMELGNQYKQITKVWLNIPQPKEVRETT
jgi:hypothetical protein